MFRLDGDHVFIDLDIGALADPMEGIQRKQIKVYMVNLELS